MMANLLAPLPRSSDRPCLHVQLDRIVLAGVDALLHPLVASVLRVYDVTLRVGHEMRQVDGLGLVETIVEIVVPLYFAHLLTLAAAGTVLVDVTRIQPDLHFKIPGRT